MCDQKNSEGLFDEIKNVLSGKVQKNRLAAKISLTRFFTFLRNRRVLQKVLQKVLQPVENDLDGKSSLKRS